MPASIDTALLDCLRQVETATVGHYRLHGFMDPGLQANQRGARIAGTAVTVQTRGIDSAPIAIVLDAIRPGDVLVIDRCGEHRHAALGAVLCKALEQAGAVGVIIDGRACDLTDIARQGMPLWCIGSSPVLGRRQGLEGGVNITIDCGGVPVRPGDAILADDSGILVIPPEEVAGLTAEGLKRQAREVDVLARMSAGERLTEIAGLPRFADHVRSCSVSLDARGSGESGGNQQQET